MHIVLYGATGHAGSRILTELLSRGHQVTAITRDPAKIAPQPNLTIKQGDADSASAIAVNIKGADAVVSAYAPPADDTDKLLPVTENFIEAVKQVGASGKAPRFLYVGGAASLEVAPGVTTIPAMEWSDDFTFTAGPGPSDADRSGTGTTDTGTTGTGTTDTGTTGAGTTGAPKGEAS